MNLHQLRIFATVVNRMSFTQAAEDLMMSQPAVSLQVKSLERSLHLQLFERVNNQLSLTQAGDVLYRSASTMLSAEDEAMRVMGELAGATRGKLVIAANTTGGMYVLPRVIREFRRDNPEAELILHIDGTERIIERVLQNVIDLAFVGGPLDDPRLSVEHLWADPLALIFSPEHPFAGRQSIAPRELLSERFIVPEATSRTRLLFERVLREAGVPVRIGLQLNGTEPVKKAVEANLGLGIVSAHAVDRELAAGHLATAAIEGVPLRRKFEMVSRSGKYFAPVGARFQAFARSMSIGD